MLFNCGQTLPKRMTIKKENPNRWNLMFLNVPEEMQFKILFQGFGGAGDRNLKEPIGGAAKGTPLHALTFEFVALYVPVR